MNSKNISILAFCVALSGIFYLIYTHQLFSTNPFTVTIQVCAICLMIWARITFGIRSFHASANTTKGALITTGPYRWLRHPIYASLLYFFWSTLIAYPFIDSMLAVLMITAGLVSRMVLEEKFLLAAYPEYEAYSSKTSRIIPFVF